MIEMSVHEISKSFGGHLLFEKLSFSLHKGDKIGLIGANGTGKSSLLKLLGQFEGVDEGTIVPRQGLKVYYVPQEEQFMPKSCGQVLEEFAKQLDCADYEVDIALSQLGLLEKKETNSDNLSGGEKKRLSLAKALLAKAHLYLFDEPTNHLDIDGIELLESLLTRHFATFVIISHDQFLLEKVCNQFIELNFQFLEGFFTKKGDYREYLRRKTEVLSDLKAQKLSLQSKVRRENEWLKQNPKARTSKSKSRIDQAVELNKELSTLQDKAHLPTVEWSFSHSGSGTKKLIETKKAAFDPFIPPLDLVIGPNSRIGICGPNGCGKTTLIKLLGGLLAPSSGKVKQAEDVRVLYFDQLRNTIDEATTLKDAICPGGDTVRIRSGNKHINGYIKLFGFSQSQLPSPLSHLSGGERAKAYIARLLHQSADVLILDEPTNDLDIFTINLLINSLKEFPGGIIFVTHDRWMLQSLASEMIGFTPHEGMKKYPTFEMWAESRSKKEIKAKKSLSKPKEPKSTLSYKEKKELELIEAKIEMLEAEYATLENASQPTDPKELLAHCQEMDEKQQAIQALYSRWEALEAKRG